MAKSGAGTFRLLILVAAALVAGHQWLTNKPAPHQTPGIQVLTSAQGLRPAAATAPAEYDLANDEARGGHTLARHVGQDDAQLRARLAREEISAASTYPDRPTAQRVVSTALAQNQDKLAAWRARKGGRPNLVLDYRGTAVIGRSLRRGEAQPRDCTAALVVLKWTSAGDFVLTSYPEAP